MRITTSTVSMAASRSYQAEAEFTQAHLDEGQGAFQGRKRMTVSAVRTKESVIEGSAAILHQVSPQETMAQETPPQITQTNSQAQKFQTPAVPAHSGDWLTSIQESIEKDPRVQILRRMVDLLERITGKKFSRGFESESSKRPGSSGFVMASAGYRRSAAMMGAMSLNVTSAQPLSGTILEGAAPTPVNGYWLRQTVQSGFVKGEEHTAFSSVGTAVTADGRTIDFGITLEMSRSFESAFEITTKAQIFTDPLVINLDTQAASLDDVSFYFDLDCDGTEEEISSLGQGSGFLALDKNGDGKINNGSELFGAKTGDGFGELAQYDQDGNGWIDENDEVFSKLSVWTKCGSGEGKLLSLKDAGVGAIFLGSQRTQFTLADKYGSENAMVRQTGIYLKENGQVGTVQHVDFRT